MEMWIDGATARFSKAIWSHHDNIESDEHTLMFHYLLPRTIHQ